MDYETIKIEEKHEGQLAWVTLGPPPANILTAKMMGEISEFLEREREARHRKLIVFSGEGKHFSFGASVEEHRTELVGDMLPKLHRFIGDVLECDVPTLAAVSGLCLGGAFELALACSFIFADETARLGVPEIQLAVFPPVACVLLPFQAGGHVANRVILTGEQFPASKLEEWGVIERVVAPGALSDTVDAFFEEQLAPKSASSLRIAHRAARTTLARHYKGFIDDVEKLYLEKLVFTADANEGIEAFLEKRKPQWQDE